MIHITEDAWGVIRDHLEGAYPREGCGILLGKSDGAGRTASVAVPCRNAYEGEQKDRFQLDPREQIAADRKARELGLDVIGFFHSHPDCDAYFSKTDLENSCPWYSFVVLSIKKGKFDHANSFLPNADQTAAEKEELIWQKS